MIVVLYCWYCACWYCACCCYCCCWCCFCWYYCRCSPRCCCCCWLCFLLIGSTSCVVAMAGKSPPTHSQDKAEVVCWCWLRVSPRSEVISFHHHSTNHNLDNNSSQYKRKKTRQPQPQTTRQYVKLGPRRNTHPAGVDIRASRKEKVTASGFTSPGDSLPVLTSNSGFQNSHRKVVTCL